MINLSNKNMNKSAKEFLGNPNYQAISYGGYRGPSREQQPSIDQIKEDLLLMHAQGFRVLRTYDVHHKFAENTLESIRQLQEVDGSFEMYVMLGAWIDCENSFTDSPNHNQEDAEGNTKEINEVVRLANKYPEIVKIIAVGNESMVHWASSYFVLPGVILKWVNYLQDLKSSEALPKNLWITSSDNFASWGGGGSEYHNEDLNSLIEAVDYISVHTYPFHDTHYNPVFWKLEDKSLLENKLDAIHHAMKKSVEYQYEQYQSVKSYIESIGVTKAIHIGETGWSSVATDLYGDDGTHAADEYKQAIYFNLTTELCKSLQISCFYFSAFDEPWKDSSNEFGSENHFGLFTVEGKAKYALWNGVDNGTFSGLGRNGKPVEKTYGGNEENLLNRVKAPSAQNME
jgi:exo-beta-1,3-glucanase (GH17 family)